MKDHQFDATFQKERTEGMGGFEEHLCDDNTNIVEQLLVAYHQLGCRTSLKIPFLHSYLDIFLPNLGNVSNEQWEQFHQDIEVMEKRYEGKMVSSLMADYWWTTMCDSNGE